MKPTPLLLPLALVSFGLSAMAPQQPSSTQGWQQSQQTDAAREITYTHFTLAGKSSQGRPILVLDCLPAKESYRGKGKVLNANLFAGIPLKVEYVEPAEIHGTSYFRKVTVQYRNDDGKEEVEKWSLGADKTSLAIPKEALKKILRAHTVEISVQDEHGSPVSMRFDLSNATPVEETCHVD